MNLTHPLLLSESLSGLLTGETNPLDFIGALCDRISSVDPMIHALLPEEGRKERLIREVNELLIKYPIPAERPPLFCIPVGVKDIFRCDGFATHAGSKLPAELFTGAEASVVTRLKKAGALILGKTETTEFAFFEPGPTCNPHHPLHTPGGSSSGSAAAVAAGMVPLALGTQTIGSITRPASFCGVIGFKPTLNRIPTDGVIPFSPSADHVGLFTQDIEGIRIAAKILCEDWNTSAVEPVRKPVFGVVRGKYLDQADSEVRSFFEKELKNLEEKGFELADSDLFGDIEIINRAHRSLIAYEFAQVHKSWFSQYAHRYRTHTAELIEEGTKISKEVAGQASDGRGNLRELVESVRHNNGVDLWISPASCTFALPGLESTGSPLMNLPWTYLGVPTLSIPAGKNDQGLPFGIQLAGSFGKDEQLVAWAQTIFPSCH